MSCESLINVINTNDTPVTANSNIPLGTVKRKRGCNLEQVGDGIIIRGAGYYWINAYITVTPGDTGTGATAKDIDLQITSDGLAEVAGTGKITLTGTEAGIIPVQAVVRITCCEKPMTIQLALGENAATVLNSSVVVVKV